MAADAPDAVVTLSDGSDTKLSTLWQASPLFLSFLRHTGCLFCREHINDMKALADANVLFVTMSEPEENADLKQKLWSPHQFASDAERVVYGRYQVARGQWYQSLSPLVIPAGIRALRKGNRQEKAHGDVFQLPAQFVINRQGKIVFSRFSKNAGDNPLVEEIRAELLKAESSL